MSYASGARVTLLSQWGRLVIQLAGFVVLARLLTPTDFGITAMVAAVVSFAALLSDFGLSLAGIQSQLLSQRQRSGLFWSNTATGLVGTIVVIASGPLLAAFYGEPRVVAVTAALAPSLLISSLAVQFRVEINRRDRFGALAMQDVTSALLALSLAVGAALLGAGYWAIVIQTLTQSLVILILAVAQARWMPGRSAPLSEMRHLMLFGGSNFLLQTVNLLSRTIDQMMIGRVQGPAQLGIYSRSSQLVTMIFQQVVTPLTRVVLPMLARAEDGVEFNRLVRQLQRLVCYGLLGLVSLSAAIADPLLPLALGDGWSGTAAIYQVLAVGAAFSAAGYTYYWASLSRARSALLIAAELPGRLIAIGGAIALAQYGVLWVAAAISAGQVVSYFVASATVGRVGINVWGLVRVSVRPALLALTVFLASTAAQQVPLADSWRLVIGLSVWVGAAALFLVVPGVREDLRQIIRSVRR